jgi:hypothetical protein
MAGGSAGKTQTPAGEQVPATGHASFAVAAVARIRLTAAKARARRVANAPFELAPGVWRTGG